METADFSSLSVDSIGALNTAQFRALTTAQVASLTKLQVAALTNAQLSGMSTRNLNALTTQQFAALNTAQIAALSAKQIVSLESADLAVLSSDQIKALTTAGIAALSTAQVVALTTSQVYALTTSQISLGLKATQLAAMETQDLAVLSTSAIAALTVGHMFAMTTRQLVALTTNQVCALTTLQLSVLSTAKAALIESKTPIVLDLNGDGISTLSIAAGVQFDLGADGSPEHTGWVATTDGLLAMDRNQDGQINDGSELFGSSTLLTDGSKAVDGYVALAALDSNQDGFISNSDTHFADLKVWVDANSDGLTSNGELKSIDSMGIVSISLSVQQTAIVDHGNTIGLTGNYQTADGNVHAAADVWFQTFDASYPETTVVQRGNLGVQVSKLVDAMKKHQSENTNALINELSLLHGKSQTVECFSTEVKGSVGALANVMHQFDAYGQPVLGHATMAGAVSPHVAIALQSTETLAMDLLPSKALKGLI